MSTIKTVPTEKIGHVPEINKELDPAAARGGAWALYLIVFVSGAVLMGIEIAGAKIMAPSFGTSTFVWGSIIGLFMGALAAGYYVGGMLADKKPSFVLLSSIVSTAGVWIWLIPRFGPALCEQIAIVDMGAVVGPLIAAFAVFFAPSFMMAMVSPYSVKLNASSMAGLGGVAGRLYSLSTFGSIVGTLMTTFVLIPMISVSHLMQCLGISLIVVAAVSLLIFKNATSKLNSEDRTGIGMMALGVLACMEVSFLFPVEPRLRPGERLLFYKDSPYHEILVTEDVIHQVDRDYNAYTVNGEKDHHADEWVVAPARMWEPDSKKLPWWLKGVGRWLKFNDNTESGIYPYRDNYKNAVGYTDLLHLPLVWVHDPAPKKILVVGGGGGIIPMQYHEWYKSEVTIAELDPYVRDTSKRFFNVNDTDGITFKIGDGRQTLRQLKDGEYDVIVLDAYSTGGQIPFHLMTWEFMETIRAKLSPRGVLVTNIISGIKNKTDQAIKPASLFLAEYKTLTASRADAKGIKNPTAGDSEPLFNQLYVFPRVYEGHPLQGPTLEEYRNVIIVATREQKRMSIDDMAATIKDLTGGEKPLVKVPDLTWHAEHQWTPENGPKKDELDSVPILTDDYAPVDTMYRPVKRDENVRALY